MSLVLHSWYKPCNKESCNFKIFRNLVLALPLSSVNFELVPEGELVNWNSFIPSWTGLLAILCLYEKRPLNVTTVSSIETFLPGEEHSWNVLVKQGPNLVQGVIAFLSLPRISFSGIRYVKVSFQLSKSMPAEYLAYTVTVEEPEFLICRKYW